MHLKRFLLLFVLMISTAGSSVFSQIQPVNPDSALLNNLIRVPGSRLRLQYAVEQALQNATDLRAAEAGYRSALGVVRREKGMFDPEFFLAWNRENQRLPTASFFAGAPVLQTTQNVGSTGLRWAMPTGTRLELSLHSNRLQTNSAFAFLNPQNTVFGNLTLRQPLLGGFTVTSRKSLEKAERDLRAAKARYDQQALAITMSVAQTYWDLYQAERDYAVQQLTVQQADALLKETALRAGAGLIGPVQVASAKTFLAQQQLLLLDREEQYTRTCDRFASLIGNRPGDRQERFVTVDAPPDQFPMQDVEQLVRRAMENNLDLQAANADIAARQALVRAASWELWPQVDLLGSIGGNGLSGKSNQVVFGGDTLRTSVHGTFQRAVEQAINRDYPSWMVGISIQVPIGLRRNKGERQRLQGEVYQAEQQRIASARTIEEQVRANYRELANGQQRIAVARAGVEAAQEQVRIGLIEFQNGRSTAFELVRLAADLASAQQRYSEALVRRAKAAAALTSLTSGAYQGGGE